MLSSDRIVSSTERFAPLTDHAGEAPTREPCVMRYLLRP